MNEIRRLGSSFGVTVVSYGFAAGTVGNLPSADTIKNMTDEEIENLIAQSKPNVTTIVSAPIREYLDWGHVEDLRINSPDFRDVFNWISKCLSDESPYDYETYQQLVALEEQTQRLQGR